MNTKQGRVSITCLPPIALVLLAGFAPALAAEESQGSPCSVAAMRGSYGYYRTGKSVAGGPAASVGRFVFDGAGNWKLVQATSVDGEISLNESFAGTHTVKPNCTGKFILDDGSDAGRFVIVDDGNGFYSIQLLEGSTIYFVATRIHTVKTDDTR